MELWELSARESIRELVAAYAEHADRGRFDELAALFTEEGTLEIAEGEICRGRDAIRVFLGATGKDLRTSGARPLIRHHVSSLRIEVIAPDRARGASYFFVVTDRGPDHWGRYRDVYVDAGDGWRFQQRHVRLEGYAPGSWAAERRGGAKSP